MRSMKLLRHFFYGLGLFLVPMPVFLLIGTAVGVDAAMLLPLLAALLLAAGIHGLKPRLRLPCVLLSAAACAGLAWALPAQTPAGHWVCVGAAALAVALYPRYVGTFFSGELHTAVWYAALAVDAAAWVAGALMSLPQIGGMLRPFTWGYCVYMIFALGLESLHDGAGRAPSRSMLLKNLGAGALWAGLFLLLTHIPQIMRAFQAVVSALGDAVAWLMSLFDNPTETAPASGGGGPMELGALGGAAQEPSWLLLLLEKLAYGAAIILSIAGLALLLCLIWKALCRGLKALAARLRAYMNAVNESYEDQVESLLDWGEVKRSLRRRRRERRRVRQERVPWDRLTPRERVRQSYRMYLIRHPEVTPQQTARQALPEARQADIYEAARYSSREITAEEAETASRLGGR